MAVNVSAIEKNIAHGNIFAFMTVPADGSPMTHVAGVPVGYHTRHLGAVQGAIGVTLGATIEGVDVEQVFAPVAHHMTAEAFSIKTTLLEPSFRNLELCAQQASVRNLLEYPSFEVDTDVNGVADGWLLSGAPTPTLQADPQPAFGAFSQQFITSGAAQGIKSVPIEHPRLIAGAIVVFSAYLKAAAGTPNVTLKIEAFNSSDVSQGSTTGITATSTSWSRLSLAYTLPAATAYIVVSVLDVAGQTATLKVDNAQIEIVASGSTATTFVGPKALFLGGRTDVLQFPVAVIWRQPTTGYYAWVMLYNAFLGGGLTRGVKKGQEARMPVEFTALPVLTRAAGNQYSQWCEESA